MALFYDTKKHEVYWSNYDLFCNLEEVYWELTEFLASKKLDGHDERDQWYMKV